MDGAFFNSGQSCCAVERVYVHESIYDAFVAEAVKVVKVRPLDAYLLRSLLTHDCDFDQDYKLGDPRKEETTLGPVVSQRSASAIRAHIADAGSSPSLCPRCSG